MILVPLLLLATLQTPTLKTKAGAEDVRLDGRLDEAVWVTADSIAGLTQVEPAEGGRPSGSTVVRVLTNPRFLIIGVTMTLPRSLLLKRSRERR